jgi:hypothetical protein
MLFAHLKRVLKLDRLRLRGPNGAHDEFLLAATPKPPETSQADPNAAAKACLRAGRLAGYFGYLNREPTSSTESADNRHSGACSGSLHDLPDLEFNVGQSGCASEMVRSTQYELQRG